MCITSILSNRVVDENLPPRLQILDKTRLIVSRVCRDCSDGTSDIRVFQCNAGNMHGAAYSSGFINVLSEFNLEEISLSGKTQFFFIVVARYEPNIFDSLSFLFACVGHG